MTPSRRYFRLTGSLQQMASDWKNVVWTQHVQAIKDFYVEAGTNKMMSRGRYLVAIKTSETSLPGLIPDKDITGYSKPDRRTKAGKQLAAKLSSLKTPAAEELLNFITPDRSWIIGNHLCRSALSSFGDQYFVSVPSGIEYQPLAEMIEIFEWQYMEIESKHRSDGVKQ